MDFRRVGCWLLAAGARGAMVAQGLNCLAGLLAAVLIIRCQGAWADDSEIPLFKRGDVAADGDVALDDVVHLLNYLFLNKEAPLCEDAADTNDDGTVDVSDAIRLLFYLFEGYALPMPGDNCGPDLAQDLLECEAFPPCGFPTRLMNSLGIELIYVKPGSFLMGSPDQERGREGIEGPVHKVTLSCGFYMASQEITQSQYKALMGGNPSFDKGDDFPVENVSWQDAIAYCRRLSAREGRVYRLPTEAEWEYVCRAGTVTRFSFGDALECSDLACQCCLPSVKCPLLEYYMCGVDHPVGTTKPNPWGFYNLHDGVREFCQDWYGPYPHGDVTDPTGPMVGSFRVIRGSTTIHLWMGRSAWRAEIIPAHIGGFNGFRIVFPLCRIGY